MSAELKDLIPGAVSFGADFIPVIGDIKGFVEAYNEPSAINIVGAVVVGVVPIAGDVIKQALKHADEVTVIGKMVDLRTLGPGERSLLDRMPNRGNARANWIQNSRVLREEMRLGRPIRDASTDPKTGALLNN